MQEEQEDKATNVHSSITPESAPLVLVVEDDPEVGRFVSQTLAEEYRVETASNGREGLQKALAMRPDLILGDVMMPETRGDLLVREARAHVELDDVPVVLLTAGADDELRAKLLREGAQDYLLKPFSVEGLRARVGKLITYLVLARGRRVGFQ